MDRLSGRPRLAPGGGFAVRRGGLWRWALRTTVERASAPVSLGVRGGPALESRWLDVGGAPLHVRAGGTAGGAVPVVLVHGVIVSGRYLEPLAVELARTRPVLVPDLPGFGHSPARPAPPGAGLVDALADAVAGCARAAGHGRVALLGNSFGAQVAVAAAERHPGIVERLVLLGPTVDPSARSLPRQALRWVRNAPDEHPASFPIMARDVLDAGPRLVRGLRAMRADRIEQRLPRVACPALVVRGGRDRVAPDAWVARAAALAPRGRAATLPGYAHMAHFAGALALAPLVEAFLAEGRAPASPPGVSP